MAIKKAVAASNDKPAIKKTACPITRAQFEASAQPLVVNIAGVPFVAEPKEFSTGSLGWNINGKSIVQVDGKPCTVQIGLNVTIVNSKEAK